MTTSRANSRQYTTKPITDSDLQYDESLIISPKEQHQEFEKDLCSDSENSSGNECFTDADEENVFYIDQAAEVRVKSMSVGLLCGDQAKPQRVYFLIDSGSSLTLLPFCKILQIFGHLKYEEVRQMITPDHPVTNSATGHSLDFCGYIMLPVYIQNEIREIKCHIAVSDKAPCLLGVRGVRGRVEVQRMLYEAYGP